MRPRPGRNSEAKQRILETADRLFYNDGLRAVGIDRIVAEAAVAKMTLYAHFSSKDDLIVAVLRYREERVLEFFRAAMDRHTTPTTSRLGAFFAALEEWFESPGFRGCVFQNAAIELADPAHAGARIAREHKLRFADLVRGIVQESVGAAGAPAAPAITLLVEGAIVSALIHGTPDAARVAGAAARTLLVATRGA